MERKMHKPIWFLSIDLNEQVHCMGGLGFTTQFYLYVCADDVLTACNLGEKWAVSKGCNVRNVSGRFACNQNVESYTFPHQIINLPQEELDRIYDKRGYIEPMREPARVVSNADTNVAHVEQKVKILGFGKVPEAAIRGYSIQQVVVGTEAEIVEQFSGDLIAVKGAAIYGQTDTFEWAIMAKPVSDSKAIGEEL